MPRARTDVRRQCAVCSRSGRIASGITLRRPRSGASEALVPECRRCPPATVGALSGGTVAGETRRKGAQHSPVKEITTNTPLNGDILMKNKKEPRLSDEPCTCSYISGRERGSDAEFTPSKNQRFLDGDPKLPKFVAERRYSSVRQGKAINQGSP